jgi:hypothetical protein
MVTSEPQPLSDFIQRSASNPKRLIGLAVGLIVGSFLLIFVLWHIHSLIISSIAENYARQIARYVPIGPEFLEAISSLIFVVIFFLSFYFISVRIDNWRKGAVITALLSTVYLTGLGILSYGFKFDPITGAARKCYFIVNGEPQYQSLTPGEEWQIDPHTGKKCQMLTPEIESKLANLASGRRPNRVPDDSEPKLFDSILGTPIVWYFRSRDNLIELWDAEGIHPFEGDVLRPIDRDVAEEWKRQLADRRRREEAERKIADEEAEAAQRNLLEKKRITDAAGVMCDKLAGNRYDIYRNTSVPGASYQLLRANALQASEACEAATVAEPTTQRYRYQLARAHQAQQSPAAKQLFMDLARNNYPSAFDNLGWISWNERDPRQAITYFEHGASLGNAEAMVSLAQFLLEGKYVRKDERRAYALLSGAAAQGHEQAVEAVQKYESQRRVGAIAGAVLGTILGEVLKRTR